MSTQPITQNLDFASSDTMDPTQKGFPRPTSFAATTIPPQSQYPDPANTRSTIQNISSNFSKLYMNQSVTVAPSKGSNGAPRAHADGRFQQKDMFLAAVADGSGESIINWKHPQSRIGVGKEKGGVRAATCAKVKGKKKTLSKAFVEENDKDKAFEIKKEDKHSTLIKLDCGKEGFREVDEMKKPSISRVLSGGRRSSFCNSKTELADFFSCSGVKIVSVDMPPFMQVHAVDCARKAYDSLEKFTSKNLALALKKDFDGVYGPAWHCIVGTSFGSFVTHSVGGFLYFSMDHKLHILLFKTTVQKAD